MSIAGSHAIRSALSSDTYAALPLITTFLSAPVVARQRDNRDTTWPPVWNITAVGEEGSNVYTVSSGSRPIIIWPEDSRGLTVFFVPPPGPAANFSIEPAGDNLVRFHVPNEDLVWTQPDDGSPVTLLPDTGLPGQRWTLENLD